MSLPTKIELEIHRDRFAPVLRELELQFSRDEGIPEITSCVDNMKRMSQIESPLEFRVHQSKSTITNYEDLTIASREEIDTGLNEVLFSLRKVIMPPQEISVSAVERHTYITGNMEAAKGKLNFSLDFIRDGRTLEDCFIFPEAVIKISTYFSSKADGLTTLEYLANSAEHFDMLSALATQQHLMVILGPPIFLSLGAPLLLNGNLYKLFSAAFDKCRLSTEQEVYRTPTKYLKNKFPIPVEKIAVTGNHTFAQFRSAGLTTLYNYRTSIFFGFVAFTFGLQGQNMLGGANKNLLFRGLWNMHIETYSTNQNFLFRGLCNMLLRAKPTIAEQAGASLNKVTTGFFRGLFKK